MNAGQTSVFRNPLFRQLLDGPKKLVWYVIRTVFAGGCAAVLVAGPERNGAFAWSWKTLIPAGLICIYLMFKWLGSLYRVNEAWPNGEGLKRSLLAHFFSLLLLASSCAFIAVAGNVALAGSFGQPWLFLGPESKPVFLVVVAAVVWCVSFFGMYMWVWVPCRDGHEGIDD